MKPAPFKYFAPTSLEETLTLLCQYGDEAKLLAGGQSLVPAMNFRLMQPAVLIDLNRVQDLFYIRADKSKILRIGAMTRQRDVERSSEVAGVAPLITETMPYIAHPQIRNRGTIGGILAHADPAAELPAVMLALNAQFKLQSIKGVRWLAARDFFTGLFETALRPDELLLEISVSHLPSNSGWAFREVARRHGDYALAGVAVVLAFDPKQQCKQARIAFVSMGNGPEQAMQAEKVLLGQRLSGKLIQEAAEIAANEDIDPPGDIHASAEFRRHLAKGLTLQALNQAVKQAKK